MTTQRPDSTRTSASKRGRQQARAWGIGAETICLWLLRLKGYRILARNWRSPFGEIDLIARRGEILAVIEVKARKDLTAAAESVTWRQRERIRRAALMFLAARPELSRLGLRFDVMLVIPRRLPVHITGAWREE